MIARVLLMSVKERTEVCAHLRDRDGRQCWAPDVTGVLS